MLATHCFRNEQGDFTADSRSVLEDTARHIRLLHALFWAGKLIITSWLACECLLITF